MAEKPKFEPKKSKIKTQEIEGTLPPDFPLGPEKFENESSLRAIEESEAIASDEERSRREEEAIDEMLEGDDEKFDKLDY